MVERKGKVERKRECGKEEGRWKGSGKVERKGGRWKGRGKIVKSWKKFMFVPSIDLLTKDLSAHS